MGRPGPTGRPGASGQEQQEPALPLGALPGAPAPPAPRQPAMVLRESPFPSRALAALNRLAEGLLLPSFWAANRLLDLRETTAERRRRHRGGRCRCCCACAGRALAGLAGSALLLLSLPLAALGLLLWLPVQAARRPFAYQHAALPAPAAAPWAPQQRRTFTFVSANLCLLPSGLAKFSNLGQTLQRAAYAARELAPAPPSPAGARASLVPPGRGAAGGYGGTLCTPRRPGGRPRDSVVVEVPEDGGGGGFEGHGDAEYRGSIEDHRDAEHRGSIEDHRDAEYRGSIEDHRDAEYHGSIEDHRDAEYRGSIEDHRDAEHRGSIEDHRDAEYRGSIEDHRDAEYHGSIEDHRDAEHRGSIEDHRDAEYRGSIEDHRDAEHRGSIEDHRDAEYRGSIEDHRDAEYHGSIEDHRDAEYRGSIEDHRDAEYRGSIEDHRDAEHRGGIEDHRDAEYRGSIEDHRDAEYRGSIEDHRDAEYRGSIEDHRDAEYRGSIEDHRDAEHRGGIEDHRDAEYRGSIEDHRDAEYRGSIEDHRDAEYHGSIKAHRDAEYHRTIEDHRDAEYHGSIKAHRDAEYHRTIEDHRDAEYHRTIKAHRDAEYHGSIEDHRDAEHRGSIKAHRDAEYHRTIEDHRDAEYHRTIEEHRDAEHRGGTEEPGAAEERGRIEEHFPEDADFLCLQEVFDPGATAVLRRRLGRSFEHVLYDVGAYGLRGRCGGFKVLNSGLLLASRYPLLAAQYRCYPNGAHEDALAAKGLLSVQVLLGSAQGQRIVGYLSCTHLQAPACDAAVRDAQLTLGLHWVQLFRDAHEERGDVVAFDVYCGDFNFDNCSRGDEQNQAHPIFEEYRDPCRIGPGRDQPWAMGTCLNYLRIYEEPVSTPEKLKRTLAQAAGRRSYLAEPILRDGRPDPAARGPWRGRRVDYVLHREPRGPAALRTEEAAVSVVTQLAARSDHLPVVLRLAVGPAPP
ncbi:sphingomyelin phosphodiesterase 3-like [Dromaius novaehollandiae]|uniref:sphingomyelin phosphodiesterase 3-like n=1 Tax=Dromaius novaehollandiae TaxID=8790 RepID=UPI00311D99C2